MLTERCWSQAGLVRGLKLPNWTQQSKTAKSTQNTLLLSVEAISHIRREGLSHYTPRLLLQILFCVISLSAYVAIKLDRMWTGRSEIVMQAWTWSWLPHQVGITITDKALSSLLMPRRTEAELKRCSQCDSLCEGLVRPCWRGFRVALIQQTPLNHMHTCSPAAYNYLWR